MAGSSDGCGFLGRSFCGSLLGRKNLAAFAVDVDATGSAESSSAKPSSSSSSSSATFHFDAALLAVFHRTTAVSSSLLVMLLPKIANSNILLALPAFHDIAGSPALPFAGFLPLFDCAGGEDGLCECAASALSPDVVIQRRFIDLLDLAGGTSSDSDVGTGGNARSLPLDLSE